ncbi:MAG: putative transcriptional regulatory protein TcrX [candidate division WS6 bacterium OLB20]|uniref:Putative transcriptional regulatory protein TcrX n=1 Tax=candidate division WS6 bacterium OLB20 TaxID=1617426 RepID=A0A136LWK0_9BACT|nr:MAG: putative transcriptional regulatory protein TcrX [candidate division WS6 bacterium OLB20]
MKQVIVLFNDSDPVLARVARVKLKTEAGWDVKITANYDEALQAVTATGASILVTELILADNQGRTGFDLIEAIRKDKSPEELPIVVLSELRQEEDKAEALAKGADYYYAKSEIGIKDLIERVQEIIGQE